MNASDGNLAALRAYEREQDALADGPTIGEGEDLCVSCSRLFDEGDLWHAGGDGAPTCTRCVMESDRDYQTMRALLEQAVAVLDISSRTAAAQSIVNQARNLLDG